MDEQPWFTKEIKYKNKKIATIHAITKKDRAELETTMTKKIIDGKIETDINFTNFQIKRMYLSLTGHDCGWEFDREVTENNISLLPPYYFDAIDEAILELEKVDYKEVEKN